MRRKCRKLQSRENFPVLKGPLKIVHSFVYRNLYIYLFIDHLSLVVCSTDYNTLIGYYRVIVAMHHFVFPKATIIISHPNVFYFFFIIKKLFFANGTREPQLYTERAADCRPLACRICKIAKIVGDNNLYTSYMVSKQTKKKNTLTHKK